MKTNKSFSKRIKVTKNGKLVTRRPGQNHFNARQTGRQRLARKRPNTISMSERLVRRFLPGNAGRAKKIAAAAAAAASELVTTNETNS
jgi:ribosomal protein L35